MIVVFEEKSEIKLGLVTKNTTSHLFVETVHGKQQKIKEKSAILNINQDNLNAIETEYKAAAEIAGNVDINFIYSCALDLYKPEAFSFVDFALEYFGKPENIDCYRDKLTMLIILRNAPIYFRKSSEGFFKCAEEEQVNAALAGIAKRQVQEEKIKVISEVLQNNKLPENWQNIWRTLVFDKAEQSVDSKALHAFSKNCGKTPAQVLFNCGAFNSWEYFHLENFLFNDFPDEVNLVENSDGQVNTQIASLIEELPICKNKNVPIFSVDNSSTDEIDDALSVEELSNGYQIGIHIAAPALIANQVNNAENEYYVRLQKRMSTVYFPASKTNDSISKIPMMGERSYSLDKNNSWCDCFSLDEEKTVPLISLYFKINESFELIAGSQKSVIERKKINKNLRLQMFEDDFNNLMMSDEIHIKADIPYFSQLKILWKLADRLEGLRENNGAVIGKGNKDFRFEIVENKPIITMRERGLPIDTLVAEMMIFANSYWATLLRDNKVPMIYRVKSGDKVGLATVALPHTAMALQCYGWFTSPLRRFVDLCNQQQLIAFLSKAQLPFSKNPEQNNSQNQPTTMNILEKFNAKNSEIKIQKLPEHKGKLDEIAGRANIYHGVYNEFQRKMERYWCLRWLTNENREYYNANPTRNGWVIFREIPLSYKVNEDLGCKDEISLKIINIDEQTLEVKCALVN